MRNNFKLLAVLLLCCSLIQSGFTKSVPEPDPEPDTLNDDFYQDDEYEDEIASNEDDPVEPPPPFEDNKNPVFFEKSLIETRAQPGQDVTLNCDVRNFKISNVALWYKEGNLISTGQHSLNSRFEIMKNNSILLRSITGDDNGNYYCEILPEKIRLTHILTVTGNLIIELDGRDQTDRARTLQQGGNHVLECKTFLPTDAEIKWSLNGHRIKVEGAKLLLERIDDEEAGTYQCLADDGSESPPHGSITIDVQYAPKASTKRHFVNAESGGSAELSCEYKGNPIAITNWYKNSKRLTSSEKYSITNKMLGVRNETILTISHIKPHDLGQYECAAENSIGADSVKVHLIFEPEHPQFEEMERKGNTVILHWLVRSVQPLSEAVLDYKLNGSYTWSTVTVIKTQRHSEHSGIWKITHEMDLTPGDWFARVRVKNTIGWSKFSTEHHFTIYQEDDDDDSNDSVYEIPEEEIHSAADNLVKAGIGSGQTGAASPVQVATSLFSASLLCLILQHLVPRI